MAAASVAARSQSQKRLQDTRIAQLGAPKATGAPGKAGKSAAVRHSLGARVLFSCTSFFEGTTAFLDAALGRARQRTGCAAARRATVTPLLHTVRVAMPLR